MEFFWNKTLEFPVVYYFANCKMGSEKCLTPEGHPLIQTNNCITHIIQYKKVYLKFFLSNNIVYCLVM